MHSPISGNLHYPWKLRAGGHDEQFLPILLTRPPVQALSNLFIDIERAASLCGTRLFPPDENPEAIGELKAATSWWIDDCVIIATLVTACLQKGIIGEDVTVNLNGLRLYQQASWTPQYLHDCLAGARVARDHGREDDLGCLHRLLRKLVGSLDGSRVRITTQFFRTEGAELCDGRATFSRSAP